LEDTNAKVPGEFTFNFATGNKTFSTMIAERNDTTKTSLLRNVYNHTGVTNASIVLYALKDPDHTRFRYCSGKTTIGCTSSDSWSALWDDGGNVLETNGGFSTTGYAVATTSLDGDTVWKLTGPIASAGQGEAGDTTPPTITSVTSSTTNGSYKAGASINVSLTFSEAVTTTGTVTVTLDSGGSCTFSGVTNSSTASCTTTVGAGENSSDLTVSSVSGTIKDQANNAMTDFAPATNLAANKDIVVDTTAPATPSATPAGNTYNTTQSVTLASAGSSALYYTLDGSTPTTSSTLYAGTVSVSSSLTLKALAVDNAGNQSTVMSESYVISIASVVTPAATSVAPRSSGGGVRLETLRLRQQAAKQRNPPPAPVQHPSPPPSSTTLILSPLLRQIQERLYKRLENADFSRRAALERAIERLNARASRSGSR